MDGWHGLMAWDRKVGKAGVSWDRMRRRWQHGKRHQGHGL